MSQKTDEILLSWMIANYEVGRLLIIEYQFRLDGRELDWISSSENEGRLYILTLPVALQLMLLNIVCKTQE